MATLADSLTASSARSLPLRARPDLSAQQQRYLGQTYWVVKEPVGLKYYRFQEEEYATGIVPRIAFEWWVAPGEEKRAK